VDAGHYDLNTCLREAIVVFKSFLIALPEDQLGAFQNAVRQQWSRKIKKSNKGDKEKVRLRGHED